MLNLYTNAIDTNGFIGLANKNENVNVDEQQIKSRDIVTGFAVLSLLVVSMIVNGTQYQTNVEAQKVATIASYSTLA